MVVIELRNTSSSLVPSPSYEKIERACKKGAGHETSQAKSQPTVQFSQFYHHNMSKFISAALLVGCHLSQQRLKSTQGCLVSQIQPFWPLNNQPAQCSVAHHSFSIGHALSCPTGAFPSIGHNEVRDITASLSLSEGVCHNSVTLY